MEAGKAAIPLDIAGRLCTAQMHGLPGEPGHVSVTTNITPR